MSETVEKDLRDDSPVDQSPRNEHSEIDGPKGRGAGGRNRETPGILRTESTSRSQRYNVANPFLTPQVGIYVPFN